MSHHMTSAIALTIRIEADGSCQPGGNDVGVF